MNKKQRIEHEYRKWKRNAPGGLALVGFGLSVTGHAIALKYSRSSNWKWVLWGTAGLAITNAGLSVFGTAVKQKTKIEILQEK